MSPLSNIVDEEKRNRIRLSLAAYCYEFHDTSFITDDEFDRLAAKIDPERATGDWELDTFFRTKFVPYSGQWIHEHPDLNRLEDLYLRVIKKNKR